MAGASHLKMEKIMLVGAHQALEAAFATKVISWNTSTENVADPWKFFMV